MYSSWPIFPKFLTHQINPRTQIRWFLRSDIFIFQLSLNPTPLATHPRKPFIAGLSTLPLFLLLPYSHQKAKTKNKFFLSFLLSLLMHSLPYLKMTERYVRYVETTRRDDKIFSEVIPNPIVPDYFSRGLKSAFSSSQMRSEASERARVFSQQFQR